MQETTDVLSELTSSWRFSRKFLRARNTANICRWLMCHERWWFYWLDPDLSVPLRSLPQPVREASVISILRRHEASNAGWNQGFFHITKARKHRRVTLIMRKGLPLRENPLVLSHHCRGLMYNSPKGIKLNAADLLTLRSLKLFNS